VLKKQRRERKERSVRNKESERTENMCINHEERDQGEVKYNVKGGKRNRGKRKKKWFFSLYLLLLYKLN